MILFVVLALSVVALVLVVALALRRFTLDEVGVEDDLEKPGTPMATYAVAPGEDAAVVVAALTGAGYQAVGGMEHGVERVLVRCRPEQRADVRGVIEHVERARSADPEMYVGHVRFQDET